MFRTADEKYFQSAAFDAQDRLHHAIDFTTISAAVEAVSGKLGRRFADWPYRRDVFWNIQFRKLLQVLLRSFSGRNMEDSFLESLFVIAFTKHADFCGTESPDLGNVTRIRLLADIPHKPIENQAMSINDGLRAPFRLLCYPLPTHAEKFDWRLLKRASMNSKSI